MRGEARDSRRCRAASGTAARVGGSGALLRFCAGQSERESRRAAWCCLWTLLVDGGMDRALAESQTGPERWVGVDLRGDPQASQPPPCSQPQTGLSAGARLNWQRGVGLHVTGPFCGSVETPFSAPSKTLLHCLNACSFDMERAWSTARPQPQPSPITNPATRNSNLFQHGPRRQRMEHPCRLLPEPSRPGHPKSMRHPRPHVDAARGSENEQPDPGIQLTTRCTHYTRGIATRHPKNRQT